MASRGELETGTLVAHESVTECRFEPPAGGACGKVPPLHSGIESVSCSAGVLPALALDVPGPLTWVKWRVVRIAATPRTGSNIFTKTDKFRIGGPPRRVSSLLRGTSLQLRVLRLGLLQEGDLGVRVFPQSQKILVGAAALCPVASERIGAGQTQLRKRHGGV